MDDIVALGFSFHTNGAEKKIRNLIDWFNKLEASGKKVNVNVSRIFNNNFTNNVTSAANATGKLTQNLRNLHAIANKIKLGNIGKELRNLRLDKIKPVSPQTIESLKELNKLLMMLSIYLRNVAKNKKEVGDFSKVFGGLSTRVDNAGSSLGKFLKTSLIISTLKKATLAAKDFGYEIAHISSIAEELDSKSLRSGLLNISAEYGSSKRLAEGLYYAYSSGIRGSEEDYLKFMERMGMLSTLIRSDVVPTINAVTSITNAYDIATSRSGEVVDLFYGIVKQGKASGEQLANGIGQVIPTAVTAGVALDELGASLATMTKVMPTRQAITYLNNMLSKMLKPTKESTLAARKYGIELGLNEIKAKGFSEKLKEIREKTNGSREALLKIFPDLRGQRAALHLLQNGWNDYNEQLTFFGQKSGIAQNAMSVLNKDLNYQVSVIPNTFEKLKVALGDSLIQIVTLGGVLTPVLTAFNQMGETAQKTIGYITAVGASILGVKAAMYAINLLKVESIRINSVLAAQRRKEMLDNLALTATGAAAAKGKKNSNFILEFLGLTAITKVFSKKFLKSIFSLKAIGGALVKAFTLVKTTLASIGAAIGGVLSSTIAIISSAALAVAGLVEVFGFSKGETVSEKWKNSKTRYILMLDFLKEEKVTQEQKEKELSDIIKQTRAKFKFDFSGMMDVFSNKDDIHFQNYKVNKDDFFRAYNRFFGNDPTTAYLNYLEHLKKKILESKAIGDVNAEKEFQKALDKAIKNSDKTIDKLKTSNQKLVDKYNLAGQTLESTYNALNKFYQEMENLKFSALSREQKLKRVDDDISSFRRKYYEGLDKNNINVVKKSFTNILKAHRFLIDNAKNELQKTQGVLDSLTSFSDRSRESLYGNDPEKLKKMSQEYLKRVISDPFSSSVTEFFKKSNFYGTFTGIVKGGVSSKDAFSGVEKATSIYIKALEAEIEQKKRSVERNRELAKSILQANNNTLKMVQAMDKYSGNTVKAVDAFSKEGFEMQNRSYLKNLAIPSINYKPDAGLDSVKRGEEEIRKLQENMLALAERLRKEEENRKSQIETQISTREKELQKDVNASGEFFSKWQNELQGMTNAMLQIQNKLNPGSDGIARDIRKISVKFHNIDGVTY